MNCRVTRKLYFIILQFYQSVTSLLKFRSFIEQFAYILFISSLFFFKEEQINESINFSIHLLRYKMDDFLL